MRIVISLILYLSLITTATTATPYKHQARQSITSASELDYPPFCIVKPNGSASGFSVELMKEVLKVTGLHLEPMKVDSWSVIKQELIDGKIDMLPFVGYTPERDLVYDFTVPYLQMHGTIFVHKGDDLIKNETDLKGKEIIVMRDDTAHEYLIKKKISDKLILTDSFDQAFKLLAAGKHDAIIAQHLMGAQLLKKLGIKNVKALATRSVADMKFKGKVDTGFEQRFCFAVQKGNSDLLAKLNEGLSIVKANGTYDRLYDKWLGVLDEEKTTKIIFKIVLAVLITLLLCLILGILWQRSLRITIKKRTHELQTLNEELESRVFKRTADLQITRFSVDHTSDFLFWLDKSGNIIDVNDTTCARLGYERAEILSRQINDLCPHAFKQYSNSWQEIKDAKNQLSRTMYITKDQISIPVDQHAIFLEFNDNEYLFVHSHDISDQLSKDLAIKNLAKFPAENPNPVLRISYNGEVLYANQASQTLLDYWQVKLNNKLPEEINNIIQKTIQQTTPTQHDIKIDNTYYSFTITPISESEYVNIYALDITDRIKTQNELREARLKAEAANNAKSDFLANMSHEIRTPLNGILGMTSLVLEKEPNQDQKAMLQVVKDSGHSLLEIVNSILEISRIEAGKQELLLEDFNINDCFHSAIKSFTSMIKDKSLAYHWIFDDKIPDIVIGDQIKFRQILVNLINNAIKYTDQGSISVQAELLSEDNKTIWIKFTVADTGIGIPEDKQNTIFDVFSQVDTSTTRPYGGVGLGLAITNKFVDMFGGKITVDSKPGVGSTFAVSLKFQRMIPATPSQDKMKKIIQPDEKKSILIVEDNIINRAYIIEILKKINATPTIAMNGIEALACFKKQTFDLILMDIQMPELDGYDTTRQIRELESTGSHIPIIAVTAHAKETDRLKCLESGMDNYLSKPFNKDDFLNMLANYL